MKVLFDTLAGFCGEIFIPINYIHGVGICSFYTNNLNLIIKAVKHDFRFPHNRYMINIDIIFNDKTNAELFEGHLSLDEIVGNVVCKRFSSDLELNLSSFCNDAGNFLLVFCHVAPILIDK